MPNQTKSSQPREEQNPAQHQGEGNTAKGESAILLCSVPLYPNVTLNFFGHKLELEDTSPSAIHTVAAGFNNITGGRLELHGTEEEFAELRDTLNRTFPLPVIEPRKTRALEQTTFHKDGPPTRDLLFQMESEILNDDGSRDWVTLHTVTAPTNGWDKAAEKHDEVVVLSDKLAIEVSRSAALKNMLDNTKKALDGALATIIKVMDGRDAALSLNRKTGNVENDNLLLQQRHEENMAEIKKIKTELNQSLCENVTVGIQNAALLAANDKLTWGAIHKDIQNAALRDSNAKLSKEAIGLREARAQLSSQLTHANTRLGKIHDIVV